MTERGGTAHNARSTVERTPRAPPIHLLPSQAPCLGGILGWQCNDVRVTITGRAPLSVEYDIGGMIWGGSRFTVVKGDLFFNGRPCLPLQPIRY
jgi:hypothetical protein